MTNALSRSIMEAEPSLSTPVVPDWAMVTAVAAQKALEGILAAGHYDSRFGGIDPGTARVLAHVLRLYSRLGHAPTVDEIAASAAMSRQDVKSRLHKLRGRDLILLDPTGDAILGAYPFTEVATGHSVTFAGTGRVLSTMCAIDALGAGAMCRDDVAIHSTCRACGNSVRALTQQGGMTLGRVAPADAVVWV